MGAVVGTGLLNDVHSSVPTGHTVEPAKKSVGRGFGGPGPNKQTNVDDDDDNSGGGRRRADGVNGKQYQDVQTVVHRWQAM